MIKLKIHNFLIIFQISIQNIFIVIKVINMIIIIIFISLH